MVLRLAGPAPILENYKPVSADLEQHALADAKSEFAEVRITAEDGRYAKKLAQLRAAACEGELARRRMMIEVEWFRMLVKEVLPPELFTGMEDLVERFAEALHKAADGMSLRMANRITEIEGIKRHDVIAMIDTLRERIKTKLAEDVANRPDDVERLLSYVHLGLTSEDVTSPAHGLMLINALRHVLVPKMQELLSKLDAKAADLDTVVDPMHAGFSMGTRYRGYAAKLREMMPAVFTPDFLTMKFSGATGTHAALKSIVREGAHPLRIASEFAGYIAPELHYLPVTAQINPHDDFSLWCGKLADFCNEVRWMCEEMWQDSGRDIVTDEQLRKLIFVKPDDGASGSSTMPQKVQVINIENAKGTAQSLMAVARGLQQSIGVNRLQRELSDSRQIREIFGDVLPKLLQIVSNIETDVPKLTVNAACRIDAGSVQQAYPSQTDEDEGLEEYTDFSSLRRALEHAAKECADMPLLGRTHNQPASPTTFGKELMIFAQRLRYLEGVQDGEYRGRQIGTKFSAGEIRETAIGVVEQMLGDLQIYARERNGMLDIHNPDLIVADKRLLRDTAKKILTTEMSVTDIADALQFNVEVSQRELNAHFECLAEAIQVVLRRYGVTNAYDITKKVTRGAQINRTEYQTMIHELLVMDEIRGKIPADIAEQLMNLTPEQFTGEAGRLALLETSAA